MPDQSSCHESQTAAMAEVDPLVILLSTEPKPQDLIKYHELAENWYVLGVGLGVDLDDLETIDGKCNDAQVCLAKLLRIWLKRGGSGNSTYKKLIKALMDVGKRDLAKSLCQRIGKLICLVVLTSMFL